MTIHAMVDIETMDTAPTAVVLSVGLALFNPYEPETPMEERYWVLDTAEQDINGRTRSQDTMKWWSEQSSEARTVLTAQGLPVREVVNSLVAYVQNDEVEHVWANGPDFDCVTLADLAKRYGHKWPFWKNRCYRTLKNLALPKVGSPDDSPWMRLPRRRKPRKITKTNNADAVVGGDDTIYTIVATNQGPTDAHGAVLRDPPPTGMTCHTVACSGAGGAVCPAVSVAGLQSVAGVVVTTFPAGGSVTLTLTCSVD